MKHIVYLWAKYGPPRLLEIFDGREDLEKKPEIPEAGTVTKRLKEATNQAHEKRKRILDRFKRKI